jgi:hypothetical protein
MLYLVYVLLFPRINKIKKSLPLFPYRAPTILVEMYKLTAITALTMGRVSFSSETFPACCKKLYILFSSSQILPDSNGENNSSGSSEDEGQEVSKAEDDISSLDVSVDVDHQGDDTEGFKLRGLQREKFELRSRSCSKQRGPCISR